MFKPVQFFPALLAIGTAMPASADEQLNRTLLGLGAQWIMNQSQQQARPQPQAADPRAGGQAQTRQRATTGVPSANARTRRIQQSLNALGYDAGRADGKAGGQTQRAIMAWQQAIGADPTGVLTDAQSRMLLSATAPAVPAPDTLPRPEMAQLQRGLAALGYYDGAADGLPGPRTANAISAFLRDRGQDPDAVRLRDAQAMVRDASGIVTALPAGPGSAAGNDQAFTLSGAAGDTPPDQPVAAPNVYPAASAADAGTFLGDLPTFEGATLVMRHDDYEIAFGGDQARAARASEALDRLWYLYLLKGDPSRLDDPDTAHQFLRLLPADAARRYATVSGTGFRWLGDNQFAHEDNRKAFLADWRARLMQMTERLPRDLVFVGGAGFGDYDATNGTLALSGGVRTGSGEVLRGGGALTIPDPYFFPDSIAVDAATARRLVEGGQADYAAANQDHVKRFGTRLAAARALQRYHVAGVRKAARGAVLDLTPAGIALYDLALQNKVIDVPLPGGAVAAAVAAPPQLDAMYPRLWMVGTMPAVLDDPAFVAESFRVRRNQEAGRRPYSYEPVVSTALRKTRLEASAQDLQAMRDWLQRHGVDLPRQVGVGGFGLRPAQVRDGQGWRADITHWLGPEGQPDGAAGSQRDWIQPALATAARLMPNAVGQDVLWSGDGMPTVVTLHPHPAWAAGVPLDFEPMGEPASLELEIVETRAVTDAGVPPFLLIDVLPVALTYQRNDKMHRIALDRQPAAAAGPARRYEIGGLRLDMPLAEAEPLARAFLGDGEAPVTREERLYRNGALTHAVAFYTPDPQYRYKDIVVLFYDDGLPAKPLIAIGRELRTDSFSSETEGMATLLPRLEDKFGKSHRASRTAYWAVDPVTVGMLEAGISYDHPCAQNDYEQFSNNPAQAVRFSSNVTKACGEMLSLTVFNGIVRQMLTDTTVLSALLTRIEAAKPAKPAPGAEIKF